MTNLGYQYTKAFEDLKEPAAVFIGYENIDPVHTDNNELIDRLVKHFNDRNIQAARFDTPDAENVSTLIVTPTGIQSPMIAPDDAKDAALLYGSIINEVEGMKVQGFPNSVVCSQMTSPIESYPDEIRGYKMSPYPHPSPKVIDEILERRGEDFESRMVAKMETLEQVTPDNMELLYSGKSFPQPHLITKEQESRAVVYSAPEINIAQEYPPLNTANPNSYSFVQTYHKADHQLKFMDLGWEEGRPPVANNAQWYESIVWPHKNEPGPTLIHKLDEKGSHVFYKIPDNDPEWKDLMEMHRPAYTQGNNHMLKRRENLKIQEAEGKLQTHNFMGEKLNTPQTDIKQNPNQILATTEKESSNQTWNTLAEKRGINPETMRRIQNNNTTHSQKAENIISKPAKVLSTAAEANTKLDQVIDKTISQGSETLNKTMVGKAYEKAAGKIAETQAVKGIQKATGKISEKIAQSTIGKAIGKTAAKIAGSALGKSIIKKIPLISLGAGCYFAINRAKDGDWKGACGEVASGALGCFPGLGTAASTAIDVGLAAKDVKQAIDSSKNANKENIPSQPPAAKSESLQTENKKIKKESLNAIMIARGLKEAPSHTLAQSGAERTAQTNTPSNFNNLLQKKLNQNSM